MPGKIHTSLESFHQVCHIFVEKTIQEFECLLSQKMFTYRQDQALVPWLPGTLQHSGGTCSLATPQTCTDYIVYDLIRLIFKFSSICQGCINDTVIEYNQFGMLSMLVPQS